MEDVRSRLSSQEKPSIDSISSPESTPKPVRRRRRVPIACASCRMRKTKCDHIVPKANLQVPPPDNHSYDYIRSLEDRVKQYELQLKALQNSCQETLPRSLNQTSTGPLPAPTGYGNQVSVPLPPIQTQELPTTTRNTCAITAASPSLFLGGEGAVSFTQLILNAMNPDAPSRVQSSTQFFSSPRDPSREMPDAKLHDLPPDVRELIRLYFDFHHVLTPIFHVPSIRPRIEKTLAFGRDQRHDDPYTLAMINMICAIAAAHRRNGFETSTVQTRKYYDRAMALVGPTVLFDWSVEKVQILLLGARYLQSSNFPDESWTLLGLAIRIAQGLELHRPPPEHLDHVQKEVRKRLWYACYTTDQLASAIYGRPVSTASNTFTTPLPDDLDDDRIQPTQLIYPSSPTISAMTHSIQNVKLCQIMESAAALVDPPPHKIIELDEQFELWSMKLPAAFRVYEQHSIPDSKNLIMAMRANMTRILIHRHSVVTSLGLLSRGEPAFFPADSLRANMMQKSREICVRSAQETIQLVALRHDSTKACTGPSWFNLYYLFNATLIIASHVVDPKFRNDREALSHLEDGMRMIAQMSANHMNARRAHIFLRQLLDLVEKTLPQQIRTLANKSSSSSSSSSIGMQTQGLPPSTTENASNGFASYAEAPKEFLQLWDNTVDLTAALGSQLEFFSSMGSGMWSWGAQAQETRSYGINQPGITP